MDKQRLYYTAIIFLGHFTFGTLSGIAGPSLVDFTYLISSGNGSTSSIKEVSYFMTFSMLGAIAGSFVSFLYKPSSPCSLLPPINRQLLTSVLLFLFGVSFALTPRLSSLPPFYGAFFAIGLGGGNWNTVSSTWLMELHEGRTLAAVLQLLQLCYGLGMIAGPVLVAPFLGGYITQNLATRNVISQRRDSLTVPYVICGAVQCGVGLLLFLLYLLPSTRYSKDNLSASIDDDDENVHRKESVKSSRLLDCPSNRRGRLLFSGLVMGLLAFYNLAEANHLNFQTPYYQSLSGPNISASKAAEIASFTATSYTVGRGFSALTASCLSSAFLILAHLTLALSSFVALLVWVQTTTVTLISINSVLIGLAFSAIMPAIFSYVNTVLTVDDRRNAAFFITLSLPSVFSPFLLGPYLQTFPSVLLYLDLGSLSLAFLFFALAHLLVLKLKRRREKDEMISKYKDTRSLLEGAHYSNKPDYGSRL